MVYPVARSALWQVRHEVAGWNVSRRLVRPMTVYVDNGAGWSGCPALGLGDNGQDLSKRKDGGP